MATLRERTSGVLLHPTSLYGRGLFRRTTDPRRRKARYRWRGVARTSYDLEMARFETALPRADHDGRLSRGQE
jgi:hypothetical protein